MDMDALTAKWKRSCNFIGMPTNLLAAATAAAIFIFPRSFLWFFRRNTGFISLF